MIKVKIFKLKKFTISSEPITFDVTLKNNNIIMKGELSIDFSKRIIRVDFGKPLNSFEQLALLKEIFYSFCIKKAKITNKQIGLHIEEFIYIDINRKENRKNIIEYLLDYNINDFNEYRRKEKIISQIKKSYDRICNGISNKESEIKLNIICNFSEGEKIIYKNILKKYLKRKKYNGALEDISGVYNEMYRYDYIYYYDLNPFYVLKYVSK